MNEFPDFLQDNQECTQGFPAYSAKSLQAQGIGSASSLDSLGWVMWESSGSCWRSHRILPTPVFSEIQLSVPTGPFPPWSRQKQQALLAEK